MRLVELIRRSDAAKALPGASPDVEVERSVCNRLYGDRAQVTATPLARGAAPLGRLVGGLYRLVERFGAGGMAIVYRARDEQLERDVAVKVIGERHARDALFVRRFRWEAQLGARLAHPNIIAEADGTAKLADFGLASDALASPGGRAHGVARTLGYVAPEIVGGARPSSRSDLYSLGAVAYRLLLGPRVPPADPGCTAPLPTAVRRMPALSEVRPGMPRGLYEAVDQALAPDPDARQESVAQFRAQLLDGHAPSRALWRGGVVPFPNAVRSQIRSAA